MNVERSVRDGKVIEARWKTWDRRDGRKKGRSWEGGKEG